MGKTITESEIKYIPKADFKKRCLSWEDFKKKAGERGVKIIDTRDSVQKGFMSQSDEEALDGVSIEQLEKFRAENKKFLAALGKRKIMSQSFDMLQRHVIGNKRYKNQTLLIVDQVGKQVRWLMYQLEAAGIKHYYFLDKGAFSVIGSQAYGNM